MLGWIGGASAARRLRRCVVSAATVLMVLSITASAQASSGGGGAPVYAARSAGITGQYIVVLKGALPTMPTGESEQAATKEDAKVASSVGAKPLFEYNADIKGFAADLTQTQLHELRNSPEVKYVDEDARVEELDYLDGRASGRWNCRAVSL